MILVGPLCKAAAAPEGRVVAPFVGRCSWAAGGVLGLALVLQLADGTAVAIAASSLGLVAVPAVAGVACLCRGSSHPDEAGWRWVGAACLTWAAAGTLGAYYALTGHRHAPFPSVADIGFVGYSLPALVGLVRLRARTAPGRFWPCEVLDAAVIAAGVLFVSWATVLGDLYDAPVNDPLQRGVGLAHPLVDVMLVSLVLALALRRPAGCRLPWLLLGAGFAFLAVSDSIFVSRILTGHHHETGHLFDLSWAIAFGLVALAATAPSRPAPPSPGGELALTAELLPYLPVLVALAVGATVPMSLADAPFLFWNGMTLLALVGVRHVVIVFQKIDMANALERRVAERTAELEGERGFLAAVLESLDEGVVACDSDGVLTVFNDATRRLHGLPAEPIAAERWAEHYSLCHPDGLTPLRTEEIPLVRALRGERVKDEEIVIAPVDRPHRLVRSNGRVIIGPGGTKLGAVVAMHDITDRRRAQLDLEHQAFHDALTGLGNRARLDLDLTALLLRTRAARTPLALVLVDLDDFKKFNDSHGHLAGDQLLVEVSRRLRSCVRDGDVAVRLGGDEFAFALDSATTADAVVAARRMLGVLARPVIVDGAEVLVEASIGIASHGCETDVKDLLRAADLAMYAAKEKGGGGYVVFEPAMQVLADGRLTLEAELRAGLRGGAFHLVYQPVVNLSTGSMTGVEALLRFSAPGRGPVPPAEFIPVAEQTGLIVPLGEWVLEEACAQLARWDAAVPAGPRLSVAVNVSLRQLDRPGFIAAVQRVLASICIDPHRLVLEITETAVRDDDSTAQILRDLHQVGVQLSIDDFGTGYSSLARLHTASVDYVKLDRRFVAAIDSARLEVPIVDAVVAMAGGLGLQTTAEGIETRDQFDYLLGIGCEEGQGYLMCPPVGPKTIAGFLRAAASPHPGRLGGS